jgi:hypothetical protein
MIDPGEHPRDRLIGDAQTETAVGQVLFRRDVARPQIGQQFDAIFEAAGRRVRDKPLDFCFESGDGLARRLQVSSSRRCPKSFQTALGPARRTASAFWISTVRPQRRQATRSRCRWISESCCVQIEGPAGRRSAAASSRTARQYSDGISSPGPGVRTGGTFSPTPALAASFSICFGVGMRQLAGRSVIPRIEHTKNERVESAEGRNPEK